MNSASHLQLLLLVMLKLDSRVQICVDVLSEDEVRLLIILRLLQDWVILQQSVQLRALNRAFEILFTGYHIFRIGLLKVLTTTQGALFVLVFHRFKVFVDFLQSCQEALSLLFCFLQCQHFVIDLVLRLNRFKVVELDLFCRS